MQGPVIYLDDSAASATVRLLHGMGSGVDVVRSLDVRRRNEDLEPWCVRLGARDLPARVSGAHLVSGAVDVALDVSPTSLVPNRDACREWMSLFLNAPILRLGPNWIRPVIRRELMRSSAERRLLITQRMWRYPNLREAYRGILHREIARLRDLRVGAVGAERAVLDAMDKVDLQLSQHDFLTGETPTAADVALYTWMRAVQRKTTLWRPGRWPGVDAGMERIAMAFPQLRQLPSEPPGKQRAKLFAVLAVMVLALYGLVLRGRRSG